MRYQDITDNQKEEIRTMFEYGHEVSEISEELNIPDMGVYLVLEELGIEYEKKVEPLSHLEENVKHIVLITLDVSMDDETVRLLTTRIKNAFFDDGFRHD